MSDPGTPPAADRPDIPPDPGPVPEPAVRPMFAPVSRPGWSTPEAVPAAPRAWPTSAWPTSAGVPPRRATASTMTVIGMLMLGVALGGTIAFLVLLAHVRTAEITVANGPVPGSATTAE